MADCITPASGSTFLLKIKTTLCAHLPRVGDAAQVSVFLVFFVTAWTSFFLISYASIDLNPDLLEVYAWSRHPELGYYKHPPFAALLATGWFAIFPAKDWSFHLFAMLNAAAGLFAVDLIARRYVSGHKRLLVLCFLMLTPFYQFHGQRFGANQTLLLLWPLAVYCFLEAFQTRTFWRSVAAGVTASVAILGKYYSIFMVAALAVAALVHPARWKYLRSQSPWISILAGLLVLAPHVYWLFATGLRPFKEPLNNLSNVAH